MDKTTKRVPLGGGHAHLDAHGRVERIDCPGGPLVQEDPARRAVMVDEQARHLGGMSSWTDENGRTHVRLHGGWDAMPSQVLAVWDTTDWTAADLEQLAAYLVAMYGTPIDIARRSVGLVE